MSDEIKNAIVLEAQKKQEDALYTSTGLFEWHKRLRLYKRCFLGFEMLAAATCVWALQSGHTITGSVLGLIAGVGPTIIDAFKLDDMVSQTNTSANQFRALKDKYRRIANIWSNKSLGSLERCFTEVNSEYDAVTMKSYPLPDKYFRLAQAKIQQGDYEYEDKKL